MQGAWVAMKNKRPVFQFLIILCAVAALAFPGCGTKGPPLAPIIKGQKIAAPFDLKYTSSDTEISLSWSHEIDTETAAIEPDSFEIFMAKKTFEACEGCPFEFETIGFVSMPSMKFSTPVEKGFKYYFRVQALDDDNMKSEHSKTVQFEYK
jgi:predicted small lipoprotein YifL